MSRLKLVEHYLPFAEQKGAIHSKIGNIFGFEQGANDTQGLFPEGENNAFSFLFVKLYIFTECLYFGGVIRDRGDAGISP
jgi:hypothetical protein